MNYSNKAVFGSTCSHTQQHRQQQNTQLLPSFEWDLQCGCNNRLDSFIKVKQNFNNKANEVMDKLLNGVAVDTFNALNGSSTIEEEEDIPTCVLVAHEPTSNIVILRRIRNIISNTNSQAFLLLDLDVHDFGTSPSLQTGIKSIVTGLLELYTSPDIIKQYIQSSLNSFDFNTFYRWYSDTFTETNKPKIVLTLRDFEALPPPLMQDLIALLSYYRKLIPINLVICVDSSPAAVYRLLPRTTLIKLSMNQIAAPSAKHTFEAVIGDIFFSMDYEPPLSLNKASFDLLHDTFEYSHNSFEHLIHTLDLLLLHHYFHPHSIFSDIENIPVDDFQNPNTWKYLLTLPSTLAYLKRYYKDKDDDNMLDLLLAKEINKEEMIQKLKEIKINIKKMEKDENISFQSLNFLRNYIHSVIPDSIEFVPNYATLMVQKFNNDLSKPTMKAVQNITLMSKTQMNSWLSSYVEFVGTNVPQFVSKQLQNFKKNFCDDDGIITLANNGKRDPEFVKFAEDVSNEWTDYFGVTLIENAKAKALFKEVWTMDISNDIELLMNPSPRHAIINGLRYPQKLLSEIYEDVDNDEPLPHHLSPDISLAFKSYIEGGRIMNVSDWFEAFRVMIDIETKEIKDADKKKRSQKSPETPKKKHKKNTNNNDDGHDDEEREKRIQARFTQAINELDSLGFLKKASSRNKNIVARTVYVNVGDDDHINEIEE